MPLKHNSERGEVPLAVGGVDLVIAAEMQGIAAVSKALGSKSFAEMFVKLVSGEPNAMIAGVESLTVQGDAGKAIKAMTIKDIGPCMKAFEAALLHHSDRTEGGEGNADAASETTKSPGGDGSASAA